MILARGRATIYFAQSGLANRGDSIRSPEDENPGMGGVAMRRVPEFDALRGLAALGVLLFHLRPNEGWTHFGMTGVHLFLVLSGFLITRIVIDHVGSPDFLRAFYARRILRIWPIYYLTLASLVILQRWLPDPPSLRGLPYYLT